MASPACQILASSYRCLSCQILGQVGLFSGRSALIDQVGGVIDHQRSSLEVRVCLGNWK